MIRHRNKKTPKTREAVRYGADACVRKTQKGSSCCVRKESAGADATSVDANTRLSRDVIVLVHICLQNTRTLDTLTSTTRWHFFLTLCGTHPRAGPLPPPPCTGAHRLRGSRRLLTYGDAFDDALLAATGHVVCVGLSSGTRCRSFPSASERAKSERLKCASDRWHTARATVGVEPEVSWRGGEEAMGLARHPHGQHASTIGGIGEEQSLSTKSLSNCSLNEPLDVPKCDKNTFVHSCRLFSCEIAKRIKSLVFSNQKSQGFGTKSQ